MTFGDLITAKGMDIIMLEIKEYDSAMKEFWDDFVLNKSINGTFLQTQNFLDYHHKSRFIDRSLIIVDSCNNIYCVIPGCIIIEDDKKIFYSHKGSSYGGLIISKKYYQARYVQEMLSLFENYIDYNGFTNIVLKTTPNIFSKETPALLEYMLTYYNFQNYCELNAYLDLQCINEDIFSSFNANKRKLVKKMIKEKLSFVELQGDNDVKNFHRLLKINLSKYGAVPIHSIEELLEFKNKRLKNFVRFFGVYKDDILLASGMVFEFPEIGVVHTQNLSTDPFKDYGKLDPITFLYYSVIKYYKCENWKRLSWGISTEECGKILNFGLIKNKENYGSTYSLSKTYFKDVKV